MGDWEIEEECLDEFALALGPLGVGVYYLWNSVASLAPARARRDGVELSGWSLAHNHNDDLVFLHTSGYNSSYLKDNPPDGPSQDAYSFNDNSLTPAGFHVKSRESSSRFMVLELSWDRANCTRDQLVKYAEWWEGYEVTGEEKEYYMALIKGARVEKEKADDAEIERRRIEWEKRSEHPEPNLGWHGL